MKRAAFFVVFAWACGSSQVEPGSSMSQPDSDASSNLPGNSDGAAPRTSDGAVNHPPPAIGSTIVTIEIADASGTTQSQVPVTFGQVFRQGDVPKGATLVARIGADSVPVQVDAKATYSDGSLRHAVLTAVMPSLAATASKLELVSTATGAPGTPLSSADLLGKNFDAAVELAIGGTIYRASAADLLRKDATHTWLSGPLATEWEVAAPLASASAAHPHLHARFSIRAYQGLDLTRVEIAVENDWAFEPSPQRYTYDATITVKGTSAYAKPGLVHYPHARWRKVVWVGTEPKVVVRHDPSYLVSTGVVPNYDPTLKIAESALAAFAKDWTGAKTEPMAAGMMDPSMPDTGGRPDIGILPGWAAAYAISMDPRAKTVTLGSGDAAGSFGIHYRDKTTDRPISLDDYPDLTILGNPGDTKHPFPACAAQCMTPLENDSAHQPSMAFLPYVVTGDFFYLEELQFWANYNMVQGNPGYRDGKKGLVKWDQIRGQAWSMRTLGQVAFITPDAHPLKSYFVEKLANNVAYYQGALVTANPNPLGIITEGGSAFAYDNGLGVAPWQDDFFTSAIGYLVELGFVDAKPLLDWKARFPTGRMHGEGYCWINGAPYSLDVRPSTDAPIYATFAELFKVNFANTTNSTNAMYGGLACASQQMADWWTQKDKDTAAGGSAWKPGQMTGYADSAEGYPSNMQPALAMAAESGHAGAMDAWNVFIMRPVKPDYSTEAQFAIVPRTAAQ